MRSFWVALGLTVVSGCRCAKNEFDDGFEPNSVLPTEFDDAGPPPQVTVGEGCWSQPIVLAPPFRFGLGDLAVRPSGDAVLVGLDQTRPRVLTREVRRDGGLGAVQVLHAFEKGAYDLELASSAGGHVVAAWNPLVVGTLPEQLWVSTSSREEVWAAPQMISRPGHAVVDFDVGIDDQGRATAVWRSQSPDLEGTTLESHRDPDGRWSSPREIIPPGWFGYTGKLFVSGRGDVRWVDVRYGPPDFVQRLHMLTIDASTLRDEPVTEIPSYSGERFALRADGGAMASWKDDTSNLSIAEYAAGAWQPVVQLTDAGRVLRSDNDSRTVIWGEDVVENRLLQSTVVNGVWSTPSALSASPTVFRFIATVERDARRFIAIGDDADVVLGAPSGETRIGGVSLASSSERHPPLVLRPGSRGFSWVLAAESQTGRPLAFFCPE